MKYLKHCLAAVFAALIVTSGALHAWDEKRGEHTDKDKKEKHEDKADKKEGRGEDRAIVDAQRWSYPLEACPVSGEKIDKKHVDFVVKGRMVRTCCEKCQEEVVKDPTEAFKKIDAAVVAAQKNGYPMKTCVVSGANLDDKAIDFVWGTRLVRLANREAVANFEKDPKAAMAKLDEAYIKAQRDSYPTKKCVVSGEELGGMGEPVEKLYGTTLVRFCCKSCIKSFEKDGDKFMKELADARAKGASKG